MISTTASLNSSWEALSCSVMLFCLCLHRSFITLKHRLGFTQGKFHFEIIRQNGICWLPCNNQQIGTGENICFLPPQSASIQAAFAAWNKSPGCYWPRSHILWKTKQISITVFCYSWPQLWCLHERKINWPQMKKMPVFPGNLSCSYLKPTFTSKWVFALLVFLGEKSRTQCKLTSLWSVCYNLILYLCKTESEVFGQDLFSKDNGIPVKYKVWMLGKRNVQEKLFYVYGSIIPFSHHSATEGNEVQWVFRWLLL